MSRWSSAPPGGRPLGSTVFQNFAKSAKRNPRVIALVCSIRFHWNPVFPVGANVGYRGMLTVARAKSLTAPGMYRADPTL